MQLILIVRGERGQLSEASKARGGIPSLRYLKVEVDGSTVTEVSEVRK